ncbi:valine--tRNA ligase [Candidatus Saccharibacteria bacterium]|nr:valine--tRNA ligase [Candidatus Saccharibacteria bacterium]
MKLPSAYEPQQYEETIYALWETSGAFRPQPSRTGEHYSIVMPPPNANGNLHIGHALTTGLQDVAIRYHRMKGDSTVYIPGADHAGFETWVVFEKQLEKEGKSRFDFSREEIYSQVWDFVEKNRGNMEVQLRELGASCDWDHLVFTLDSPVIKTAYATFRKLWEDDLIYRGKRIVNYCTKHKTSFADIEVEHREEKGSLWHIRYALTDGDEVVVATTRPETLLGDTAIAVHPDDPRFKHLVGKTAIVPIVHREIPIVGDDAIDIEMGTGAVKVTPAHDPTDFEIGGRHQLDTIEIIDANGLLNEHAPMPYRGMTVLAARAKVVETLEASREIVKEDAYIHSVGVCYKCGTVIEPLLREQWFIRMQPLAERAIKALKAKKIKFYPQSKAEELIHYLGQLRDWNLSRQIPWGIPIPAFQNETDDSDWVFDERVDQPVITVNGISYRRDEDTFDTWFSSGQWPYIVTRDAHNGELHDFFPTSLMETGVDLLRQWVGRMIMLSLYATDEVPFREVYMHGMVLDEQGKKMSKSKGNVINPQDIIREYGSDALRFGLLSARSAGQHQAFGISKVTAARNFCNKLWNIARYVESKTGEPYQPLANGAPVPGSSADHWIIRQLNHAGKTLGKLLDRHQYAEAGEFIYHLIWNDVADWYIEASKQQDNVDMLAWVLETSLKLAHPFLPFATETVWQKLGWHKSLLINEPWPTPEPFDEAAAKSFEQVQSLVSEIRVVTSELGKHKQNLLFMDDVLIAENSTLISWLGRLEQVREISEPSGLRLAVPGRQAWLDMDADTLYEHQSKLEVRLVEARERAANLQRRLDNKTYVSQAPPRIVEETRHQLAEQQSLVERLQKELEVIG